MQTFLPYPEFTQSAACLDNKRLGKQRVEALTILRTLCGQSQGWKHHPAVKMWAGYELVLQLYLIACVEEWHYNRGFNDTCLIQSYDLPICGCSTCPPWLGDDDFHAAHRSNLLRKDPAWYGQFGWTEEPSLPYVWPKTHPQTY